MLRKIDYKNNKNSIYLCDRCKQRIKANERYVINVHITKLNIRKKKYDFCEKCYKSLERGVGNARNKI